MLTIPFCAYLAGCSLTDETISRRLCSPILPQSQTLDMCMRGGAVFPRIALDFTDVDHFDSPGGKFDKDDLGDITQEAVGCGWVR